MKSLTWQFATSSGMQSAIIRMHTRSEFSHVDVVTEDGQLLGARLKEKIGGNGVQIRPANYHVFTKKVQVTVQVTDAQYDAFWAWIKQQIGKPYDWRAIIGLSVHRDWREDDSWFCSELQARAVEVAGIINIDQKVNWIDPEMFRLLIMAIPGATSKEVK